MLYLASGIGERILINETTEMTIFKILRKMARLDVNNYLEISFWRLLSGELAGNATGSVLRYCKNLMYINASTAFGVEDTHPVH